MVKLPFKTIPAQIAFSESETFKGEGVMIGRLLDPHACWDSESGQPVTWTPWVRLEPYSDGRVRVAFQGRNKGGRRYKMTANMAEAQDAARKWAGRRFRIAADGSRP